MDGNEGMEEEWHKQMRKEKSFDESLSETIFRTIDNPKHKFKYTLLSNTDGSYKHDKMNIHFLTIIPNASIKDSSIMSTEEIE